MSDALAYFKNPDTEETQKFVAMVDRFFDCLNVRSKTEWALKRKPDLKPYSTSDDDRFDVSIVVYSYTRLINCVNVCYSG